MDKETLRIIFSGNNFRKYQFLTNLFSPQEILSKPQNILYLSLLKELELKEEDISYGSFIEGIKRTRKKLKENQFLSENENPCVPSTLPENKQLSVDSFLQFFPPPRSSSLQGREESVSLIKTIKDIP